MMRKVVALLFIWLCISGCMSDRSGVYTELTVASSSGDTIGLLRDGDCAVIDVRSESGIGQLELLPVEAKWPAGIIVRLHLRGLESLRINNGSHTITTSVTSSFPHKQLCEIFTEGRSSVMSDESRYWLELKVVNEKAEKDLIVPLDAGYFEVIIPAAIFDSAPKSISVEWVDFYRI